MKAFAQWAATSVSTSTFTLATHDLAPDNYGAGTLLVRVGVIMFEAGGGTYSTSWEKVATFRVNSSNVPTLIGSVVDGNAASGGRTGNDDVSAVTLDVSGTTIRVRVTPAGAGTRYWYGLLEILGGRTP